MAAGLVHIGLNNAALAGLLALGALAASRWGRRPALAHALWILVLLKLVTPPLVPLKVLPARQTAEPPPIVVADIRPEPDAVPFALVPAPVREAKPQTFMPPAVLDMIIPPELRAIMPPELLQQLVEAPSVVDDAAQEPEILSEPEPESEPAPAPASSAPANPAFHWTNMLTATWLLGSVAWLALALVRIVKFRRWLRFAEPAPASLVMETERLAKQLGLSRCPAVRLVPGPVPPMIWATWGRATLYFPKELLARLDPARRDTLLVHELAHLRRGDHWLRGLEILALALYWWFPLTWLAKRELRRVEEECCDARVLEALPESARTYAAALLDAVDFLAGAPVLPAPASGLGPTEIIKRRLVMILHGSPPSRLPVAGRLALLLLALSLLPLFAAPQEPPKSAPQTTAAVAPPAKPPATPGEEPFLYDNQPTQLQSSSPRWWTFAVSPDGKMLTVCAGDNQTTGEIWVFDLPAGTVRTTLKHTSGIRCVAFSPDGKTLAAGTFDNALRLYDVATWKLMAVGVGHKGAINSVAFTSDGKLMVTGALDNTIAVWQTPTVAVPTDDKAKIPEFKPYASLEEHTNWVLSIAISRDDKTIVSGGRDNMARLWDLPAPPATPAPLVIKKSRMVLTGHANAVETVAISPDGATVGTGSWDNSARTWNAKDGKLIRTFTGFPAGLTAVIFSKDGKELATACDGNGPQGGQVRRYELASGNQIGTHGHQQSARGVLYSPDGEQLLSLGAERAITRVAVKANKPMGQIRPPAGAVDTPQIILSVAYSPDGKQFAAAGENKKITIWNLGNKESRSWPAHDDVISSVTFSSDSNTLATASHDKTIKLWDIGAWKAGPAPPVRVIKGHTNWIFALAFSHDGKKLASGSYDKSVRVWDLAGWKKLAESPPALVLKAHSAGVRAVAFSPDDKLLASAGADRTTRIWTVDKGEQVTILRGHKGTVRAVAFAPDGKTIATGSEDKTVKLWELTRDAGGGYGHKERAELSEPQQFQSDMVAALAFSPKGRTLAAASWNGIITIWDPELAKRRTQLAGHGDGVTALAFAPDAQQLASGSFDKTIRFWPPTAPPTGGVLTYAGHPDAVWSVALSPDGKWSATGGRDGALRIFERYTTKPIKVIDKAHTGGITCVAYSRDGQTIATVGKDKVVRLWTPSGEKLRELTGHADEINVAAFSPDGKRLATAGKDKNVVIWDVASGKDVKKLAGHTDAITAIVFSPDGKLLASAGMDRGWRLWDTDKWEAKHKSPDGPNNGQIMAIAFTPDGKTLAMAHNQDQEIGPDGDIIRQQLRNVMFVDTNTGKPSTGLGGFVHQDWITGMVYSTDGQSLITASRDMTVRFWNIKNGQITRQFRAHNAGIAQMVLAGEDGLLATAGEDRQVTLWAAAFRTQAPRALLTAHTGQIWFAELSNDGQYLATGGTDKRVQLRDSFAGTQPFTFSGSFRGIYSVAASRDGKLIASGHGDGKIEIWDGGTGKKLKTLTGNTMRVWGLAFSPDGKQLFSSSGDWDVKDKPGEVKLWNLDDGKVVREFTGHAGAVYNIAVSADGKTLATACHDQNVRLWEVDTGKPKHTLSGHKQPVRTVAFSPDGLTVASASNADLLLTGSSMKPDAVLIFWDVKEGKEKSRHKMPDNTQVNRVRYSPDGKTIAIAANVPRAQPTMQPMADGVAAAVPAPMAPQATGGGRLLLWDVATAKVRKEGVPQLSEMMLDVAFGPGGHTVVTVGGEYYQVGNVRFWDVASGGRVGELHGHQLWCEAVAYLEDGRVVSAGGTHDRDGELKIWNANGLRPVKGLDGHTGTVGAAAFSPDKSQLATAGGTSIFLWDIAAWPPKGAVSRRELIGHTALVRCVKYTSDGKTLISSSEDGTVRFWDAKTGEELRSITVSAKPIYSIALSPDGKWLVTGGGKSQENTPGEVKVWDMASGKLVKELPGFVRHVWSVVFSPDGKLLATAGGQATAKIWNTGTWTEKMKLPVPMGVRAIAFSPDSKLLATASETNNDAVVRLWDVQSGRESVQLQGFRGLVFCLRFSPDGKTILASGDNASVNVWDVPAPKAPAVAQK